MYNFHKTLNQFFLIFNDLQQFIKKQLRSIDFSRLQIYFCRDKSKNAKISIKFQDFQDFKILYMDFQYFMLIFTFLPSVYFMPNYKDLLLILYKIELLKSKYI